MNDRRETIELNCPRCSWAEVCGPSAAAEWLRRVGKLRGRELPEWEILVEVLRAAAEKLTCPRCGATGLAAGPADAEGDDWPEAAVCRGCGRPIPPERLEAVPGTTYCAACQGAAESGREPTTIEYCPRCGAPMEPRLAPGGGVARYVMTCTAVPPCRPSRR